MEFLTSEATDRFGVAAFVQSREEVIDVVRVRPSAIGRGLYQLFNHGAHRDLARLGDVLGTLICLIINFQNYLFHSFKLAAKSGRVKVRGIGRMAWPIEGIRLPR